VGLSIVLVVFEARPIDFEFGTAINAFMAVTFFFLCERMVAVGLGKRTGLGKWFCAALFAGLAILLAIYLPRMN
jgi:hypothetical protein